MTLIHLDNDGDSGSKRCLDHFLHIVDNAEVSGCRTKIDQRVKERHDGRRGKSAGCHPQQDTAGPRHLLPQLLMMVDRMLQSAVVPVCRYSRHVVNTLIGACPAFRMHFLVWT